MKPINVIAGPVTVLDRADVDTDQIMPKQFLKKITRTGYGEVVFYDWIRNGEITLEPNPVLVAGRNFGCGSSREHAVWGIQQFGFDCVIAPSFSDIFYNNATKNGLLPVGLDDAACAAIAAAGEVSVNLPEQKVSAGGHEWSFEIDPDIKNRLVNGLDEIALTLAAMDRIEAWEADPSRPQTPVTTG